MKHQKRVILGGFMGNLVEAYDMSICYFLANEISFNLLGTNKNNTLVILTLIFLAYLAKPVGSIILGLLSDLFGRKNILMLSVLIMGLSTSLIGMIPTYNQIGIAAAGILLTLRIIQSMALGSEFLNSASFLVESGNDKQKGFRGCWSSVGVKAGYLLACIVTLIFHTIISYSQLDWLWRVPFFLAIVTTLVGTYIRYKMPESLSYVIYYADHQKPTTKNVLKQSFNFIKSRPFLVTYAFCTSFLSVTTGFFFYLYIPLHAGQYAQLPQSFIMLSTMLSLGFVSLLIPIFGYFSDTQDRLKMLLYASVALLSLAYPFMQAVNFGNAALFVTMQLVISIPCACYYSVSSVILTELFPLPIRCTGLSIVFSIAASLAAGLPPLVANYLVLVTQRPNTPALIIIFLAFVVILNIRMLSKTYRTGNNTYEINEINQQTNLSLSDSNRNDDYTPLKQE